ncbi:MAG TPA: DUF721 domain-containing protein [Calditrichaeota bacterium]|nr:DUF721 domain-containing protein [Calditrichota bacterium]
MKKKASSIGSVLQNILKQYELEQKYNTNYIIQFWQEIVPENIYKICYPVEINEGKLKIKVSTEAWQTEILNNKKALIQMVNDKTGRDIITDIKVI